VLTRIEVDGFKNLLGFSVELGPFTCIAGPNGTGKSNVFDVIRFLSLLTDHEMVEAARLLRSDEERSADPRELFWTDGVERADTIRMAVEMIVPKKVHDDFGRAAVPSSTFLRYELELGYEAPSGLATLGSLRLLREELTHITLGDAANHLRFPHRANSFRRDVVINKRAGTAFISTTKDNDDNLVIQIHQDGGSRGQPRPSPGRTSPRTIVNTVTTSSDPTILAAKREMQSWRALALEPSAMRRPDRFIERAQVAANGAHLAAALYRMAHSPKDPEKPGRAFSKEEIEVHAAAVYARVAMRLSRLLGVRSVRVDRDDRYERLTLEIQEHGGGFLPARSLSEGTLRFLALILLDEDPESLGLICMEEPENGIHPARMEAMVSLVGEMAVDPDRAPGDDNPMRQVVVNTHSPRFLQIVHQPGTPWSQEILFAKTATVRRPSGRVARALRLVPLSGSWRCTPEERGLSVAQMLPYLTQVTGSTGDLTELLASDQR